MGPSPERIARGAFDAELVFAELVELLDALLAEALDEDARAAALRYLDANLPDAEIELLLEWPGEWFGNRWFEEAALSPEEIAGYALERCERRLPGQPPEDE